MEEKIIEDRERENNKEKEKKRNRDDLSPTPPGLFSLAQTLASLRKGHFLFHGHSQAAQVFLSLFPHVYIYFRKEKKPPSQI